MKKLKVLFAFYFLVSLSGCSSEGIFPDIGTNLSNPLAITVNSSASRAYLVNSNNKVYYKTGSLQVLDISTPTSPVRVGTVETASFSGQAYLDETNGYIYLSNRLSDDDQDKEDSILRINITESSGDFLRVESYTDGSNPFGLAYDASSSNVYAATSESAVSYFSINSPQTVTSTSLTNLSLSDGTTLASSNLRGIAILNRQAFVTRTSGGVIVFDLDEKNVDYFISDLASPRGIATDGTNIYVVGVETSGGSAVPTLFVLNPAPLSAVSGNVTAASIDKDDFAIVAASVEVGNSPQEVAVGANYIFVSNVDSDSVTVINRPAFTKNTDITVGDEPFGMAVTATHLFVTNIQSNTVSVIDLATLSVATTYQ